MTENYTEEDASGAAALDSTEVTESEVENDISDHDSGSLAGSLFPLSQTSESSSISTPSFSDFTDSSSIQSEANISPMFSPQMSTYKLVGDNIDREVRPRDMRSDYQTRSLHYFHTYAVKDRVDLSSISDLAVCHETCINIEAILPSIADMKEIRKNIGVLFARVLKKYMPFFNQYGKGVEKHIRHQFSSEMSKKSEVVCYYCCFLCKNNLFILCVGPTWN